ncbi:MAG TPA: hypothetical protein PLL69_02430 [Gemmatimonadales bacterium]|nr:hypothetical protein [Gemmatimonadales bacterium]
MIVRAAALLGLVSAPLAGQGVTPPRPALPDLPASVRSAGLAGIAVPLPGDAAVVFVNPSSIGPLRRLSVEASYASLSGDRWYTTGAAALRVGRLSAGGGYRYLDYTGDGPVAGNLQWVAAVAGRVAPFHLGVSAKYVAVEDSSGEVYRTLTEDAAVTLAFFDIAAVALSFNNLGRSRLSGARLDLPASTHLGFSLNLIDTYSNGRLLATAETIWTHDAPRRTLIGLEGGVVVSGVGLVARVGHGGQPQGSGAGKTAYGGSLVLSRARIDYAFQPRTSVGRSVHLVGLHWTP